MFWLVAYLYKQNKVNTMKLRITMDRSANANIFFVGLLTIFMKQTIKRGTVTAKLMRVKQKNEVSYMYRLATTILGSFQPSICK